MQMKINLIGLRNALRKFENNGMYAESGKWAIARGGYALAWQLYYRTCTGYKLPVVDCIQGTWDLCGTIENDCLPHKEFERIAKIICEEYKDVKIKEDEE